VVTGASSGIGEAVARRLVAEGALVTIGSRSEPVVAGTTWVPTDVADPSAADALIDAAVDANGGLDVLVNNAGVQVVRTLADTTDGEFDHVMGVNVRGVFNCCRAAIRRMRHHGGGSIINISSIYGLVGSVTSSAYHASKGAVRIFNKSTAIQYASENIRANSVHPGFVDSPMTRAHHDVPGINEERVGKTPLGRMGLPEDIAAGILYLASDESSFVTGAELVIDGGMTAQ